MIAPDDPESPSQATPQAARAVPTAETSAEPTPAAADDPAVNRTVSEIGDYPVDVAASARPDSTVDSIDRAATDGSGDRAAADDIGTSSEVLASKPLPARDSDVSAAEASTHPDVQQASTGRSDSTEETPTAVKTTVVDRADEEDFEDEDVEPSDPLANGVPIEVTVAAGLMGVMVVLQLLVPIQTLLAGVPTDRWGIVAWTFFQWFGFLAAYLFFGISAYRGEHWARIVLLVFAVIIVLGFLADSDERVFGMAAILHTSAVIMLFLPGTRRYFRVVHS